MHTRCVCGGGEGRSADLALRTAMGEAMPDAYKVGGGGEVGLNLGSA